jgi:hypothetical protein
MADADSRKSRRDLIFVFAPAATGCRPRDREIHIRRQVLCRNNDHDVRYDCDARNAGLTKNRQGQYIGDCGSRTK